MNDGKNMGFDSDLYIVNLLSKNEKKLLIELICNEQTCMIVKDHTKYESDRYKELEALKVKIKDM